MPTLVILNGPRAGLRLHIQGDRFSLDRATLASVWFPNKSTGKIPMPAASKLPWTTTLAPPRP